jgi:heme/copper-type cytochrome/quinol oxidase subunit 2
LIPGLILLSIALPSFALLFDMDTWESNACTLKVYGNQWYWSYEESPLNGDFDYRIRVLQALCPWH